MTKRKLLSPHRTREFLEMDKVQVYELIEAYRMDYENYGRGEIAIYVDELERFLEERKSELHETYRMQGDDDWAEQALQARDAWREALSPRKSEADYYWGEENYPEDRRNG